MTNSLATADAVHPNSTEAGLTAHQSNRIPAWKVFEATKALPEEQRLAIRWLHGHYYDSGRSLAEIGELIGYDGGNVSRFFANKYEGNLADVCRAIERYRKLMEDRAAVSRAPYIETSLYQTIADCCEAALTYQKLVYLFGESQVGKTAALEHYTRLHNHGQTCFVTMPVGGSMSHFLAALAAKVRMNNSARGDVLQLNIMKCFGPNNLLIVDEVSRALQAKSYAGYALKTMDFIRDLHDQTGCGVVLCGTNVFRDQMQDRSIAKFLNQFNRRCLIRRQLPDVPSRADLNAFARHYGLEQATGEAYELQKSVVKQHGLGVWLTTLRAGSRRAANSRKAMTWEHVIDAYALLRRMEEPTTGEE